MPRNVPKKAIYSSGEIATLTHVAPRTVSRWIDTNMLPGFRIPGTLHRRVTHESLIEFLKKHNMPIPEHFNENKDIRDQGRSDVHPGNSNQAITAR